MKQKVILFFLCFIPLISCKKDDPPEPDNFFDLSLTSITVTAEKDATLIVVKTNRQWEAVCDADWLSLSAWEGDNSTGFLIGATANRTFSREAIITISSGETSKERA